MNVLKKFERKKRTLNKNVGGKLKKQNGMLHHSLVGAVIFFSLQHFIALPLDYCPTCKAEVRGIAIRVVNSRREQSSA